MRRVVGRSIEQETGGGLVNAFKIAVVESGDLATVLDLVGELLLDLGAEDRDYAGAGGTCQAE